MAFAGWSVANRKDRGINYMQIINLPTSVKNHMHQVCGAMNLPDLSTYESVEHFLTEIRNRVSQAKSLAKQALVNLGDGER